MEGLVALGLAILSVPFLLPIAAWVASRRLRHRVIALEAQVERQDQEILELRTALMRLSRTGRTSAGESESTPPRDSQPATLAHVESPPPIEPVAPVAGPSIPLGSQPVEPPPVPTPPEPPAPPTSLPPDAPSGRRAAAPPPRRPPSPRSASPPAPPSEPAGRSAWSFDWERVVGVKLFSAIAGIALVFAAVLFLRYSIDHGWLQPPVRVAIGVLTAVALLVVCERKAARKYP